MERLEAVDALVIGAGVVGLAVGAALVRRGHGVLVLERHDRVGTETSSRNSEVIHAGIYYPPGSLKARLCVAGRALLYDLLPAAGVAHRRVGKLIVATEPAAVPGLLLLRDNARAAGVTDLVEIDGAEIRRLEPQVRGVAALLSPSTGIVDSHGLMAHYLARVRAGGLVALRTAALRVERQGDGLLVHAAEAGAAEAVAIPARVVVAACGLDGDDLLRRSGVGSEAVPDHVPVKGEYFGLRRAPVSRLVYPMPPPGGVGLGIHVTLDLGGQARLGPNTVALSRDEARRPGALDVDPAHAADFLRAAQTYLPGLEMEDLAPGYAGLRPRLAPRGFADFLVRDLGPWGLPGLLALAGIESPGLTAAPALAELVADLLAPYL